MTQDIEKMIKTTIQAKVIEAFNETPDMVEKMIEAAFSKEVDEHGLKPDRFNSQKMPWIDWLVGEEIRNATRQVVRDYLSEHSDSVKAKLRQTIAKADFGTPLADKMSEILADDYRWSIQLTADKE